MGRQQWARAEAAAERFWQVEEARGAAIGAVLLAVVAVAGHLFGWRGIGYSALAGLGIGAGAVNWLRRIG